MDEIVVCSRILEDFYALSELSQTIFSFNMRKWNYYNLVLWGSVKDCVGLVTIDLIHFNLVFFEMSPINPIIKKMIKQIYFYTKFSK